MAADAHEIDVHLIHIHLYLTRCLCCISVKKNFKLPAELANLFDVLANSNLIVNQNNTDTQHLLLGLNYSLLEELNIKNPIFLHRQICHFESLQLKMSARVKDALMFNLCRDYVLSLVSVELSQALKGHII